MMKPNSILDWAKICAACDAKLDVDNQQQIDANWDKITFNEQDDYKAQAFYLLKHAAERKR